MCLVEGTPHQNTVHLLFPESGRFSPYVPPNPVKNADAFAAATVPV